MKIALFGYGKMGKLIEKVAIEKGHTISGIFDNNNSLENNITSLIGTDIVIDFSTPNSVLQNIKICLENNIPIVVGTTGWYDSLPEVSQWVNNYNGALLYAGNFSIGVNIFFKVNAYLAKIMAQYQDYKPLITEIHHTQKLDAPSGTAVTIANDIIANNPLLKSYTTLPVDSKDTYPDNNLLIQYDRIENVIGEHEIAYTSNIDKISLSHSAFTREGFAHGSLIGAEFLLGKKGLFNHNDLFNF